MGNTGGTVDSKDYTLLQDGPKTMNFLKHSTDLVRARLDVKIDSQLQGGSLYLMRFEGFQDMSLLSLKEETRRETRLR